MSVIAKKRAKGTTYYVETWWNKKAWREHAGTDKRQAERLDAQRKREVAAGTFEPTRVAAAPKTVAEVAEAWGAERANVSASDDRRNLRRFTALPDFAGLHVADVRPRHVIAALAALKRDGKVTAKTLQNAYGTMRTMFRDAQIQELVTTNPCVLPRGYFADDEATEREAYTRTEATILLAHHAIPEPIRVLTALCLLAGMRLGEAAGRRWRDLDTQPTPLWALDVGSQYGGRALKTKKRRVAPVHPDLQAILERWGRIGFVELTGHLPTPDDFIVPNVSPWARVAHHTKSTFNKAFVAGCAAAGIPNKTLHSTRHTMITLARRGGGDKAVLSKVTHNAKGDIVDRYTHRDWAELCEAVMALGTLSAARSTLHLPPASAGETAYDQAAENADNAAEVHESGPADPSSIPGASTTERLQLGSENNARQSARQCDSSVSDVLPRTEESSFAGALLAANATRSVRLTRLGEADPELAAPGLAACRALDAAYDGDAPAMESALADMAQALGGRS